MRASLDWIRQWIALPESTPAEQVADAFVQLGFEVEEIHTVEPTVGDLVVGRVLTVEELTELQEADPVLHGGRRRRPRPGWFR